MKGWNNWQDCGIHFDCGSIYLHCDKMNGRDEPGIKILLNGSNKFLEKIVLNLKKINLYSSEITLKNEAEFYFC